MQWSTERSVVYIPKHKKYDSLRFYIAWRTGTSLCQLLMPVNADVSPQQASRLLCHSIINAFCVNPEPIH